MQNTPNPDRHLPRQRHSWRRAFLLLPFVFLVLSARGAESPAPSPIREVAFAGAFPSAQFAIGDFDGDVRPDFATVQGGSNFSGDTNYRIQLRLTAAGPQSISLVAPAGGLWIEARDVNGDHAIDLVLATAWLKQPVAIFLNDGHGRFSRSETQSFPAAFRAPSSDLRPVSQSINDALGIQSSSAGSFCICRRVDAPLRPSSSARASLALIPFDLRPHPHSGRAPPSKLAVA